ncbi:transcription factor cwo isoform X2 [Anopheles darlingi]|uniref:transcription factor cwo isoform X2 n=1 Tax=Anopheles darlingi TaxID=43151 RepID=UPI0020FFF70B|nr:transcription factor cwo isoform X2 [Anopheles darlingi]
MDAYWEAANGHAPHSLKYESEAAVPGYTYCGEPGLNFSTNNTTYSEDDADFPPGRRGKTSRQDPLSHRIIEKRRRDRMNSCLADLSRLIPQQYMRKGRGRVEKTEIIEMAIRHLKNLQNQECGRESSCAEQYRLGYNDCLTEAAKFMLRERGEELVFRMVTHLKEHCNDIMKSELLKSRCGSEMANGGSPIYLAGAPIGHLRDMMSCPSDIEHSSNDHHDVKDLSFRSGTSSSTSSTNNNPPQAPVITSTAPSVQHLDTSSNHSTQDYDAPSPPRICGVAGLQQDTNNNLNQHESVLRTIRMRKFSEHASPEHEHSHNSYKFKNYIQQRFSQDTHENGGSGHPTDIEHSPASVHDDHHHHHHHHHQASLRASPMTNGSTGSLSSATDSKLSPSTSTAKTPPVSATSSDEPLSLKRKLTSTSSESSDRIGLGTVLVDNSLLQLPQHHSQQQQQQLHHQQVTGAPDAGGPLEKKVASGKNGLSLTASASLTSLPTTEIKHEMLIGGGAPVSLSGVNTPGSMANVVVPGGSAQPHHHHHHSSYHPVPIFACHTQGFYIPLNVDYEALLPYLNGADLLSKSFAQLPPLHPISISVNYSGSGGAALLVKATVSGLSSGKSKLVEGLISGC